MPGVDNYTDTFERVASTLFGQSPEWLQKLREKGLESFKLQGFPTLRNESWRFTRTKAIQERDFTFVEAYKPNGLTADQIATMTFDDTGHHRIVIADGHFAPELSRVGTLPEGVVLMSLADALATRPELVEPYLGQHVDLESNPFVALNTAFLYDGVLLHIPRNVVITDPVHIVLVSRGSGVVTHPRILVVAGESSEATILESYVGASAGYFTNAVTELVCAENSRISHCKLQMEHESAFHIATQEAHISSNARFSTENFSLGAAISRNDVNSYLGGQGIDCRMDGLYLGDDRQHIDNHTRIRHAEPHCHSFELYKGVLAGKSRGVFNGHIYVDQDAQKTDAKQENRCLLLSDDARINTSPQLEIFADDVKCTHGATVGQLDENSVFYMRSRGIDRVEARHLLVYAFAAEVIERVKVSSVRERLESDLFSWLSRSFST